MTDYIPSGKPEDNTRGISKQVRDELVTIQTAINSKSDRFSYTSVSTTSMAIATGLKTFLIEQDKDFVPPQTVFIADALAPTLNNMLGNLVTYDPDTGVIQVNVTAITGSGTKSSWTIGLANDNGVTLVNNTFSGYQNFAQATVASHATDSDIWNAAGNQINFTGVETVTDFPDALQAGASRTLICAAACSFTASANMLIDGVSSGSTVTCAANDVVIVRAISATQFRLTRIRYDGLAQKTSDNEVRVIIANGRGAVNTKVPRFTTISRNVGTAITYADSANNGASFTINENGDYGVFFTYEENGGIARFGASLNSSQLTTNIQSITAANIIFISTTPSANYPETAGITRKFVVGDVIRPHDEGVGTLGGSVSMSVIKLQGL